MTQQPAVRPLDGVLRCAKHGFPMIYVGDGYTCVAEYLDWAIGGQAIVDAVEKEDEQGDPLTALVFESGATMPLYHHNGDPLLLDREELLNAIAGMRVKGFAYTDNAGWFLHLVPVDQDDDEDTEFILGGLSLDSVRSLEVPVEEED